MSSDDVSDAMNKSWLCGPKYSSLEKKQRKCVDKDSIGSPDPVTFRVIQQLSFDPKDRVWSERNMLPEVVTRFKAAAKKAGFQAGQCSETYDDTPTLDSIVNPFWHNLPLLYNSENRAGTADDGIEIALPEQEEEMYGKERDDVPPELDESSGSFSNDDGVGTLLKKEISQYPDSNIQYLFDSLQLDESLFKDKRRSRELYSYIKDNGGMEKGLRCLCKSIHVLASKEVDAMVADVVAEGLGVDWKRFARRVQISEPKIDEIDTDFNSVYEKAIQSINTWIRQSGEIVCWGKLKSALSDIPRQDIIRSVNTALVKEDQDNNLRYHGSKETKYIVDESIDLDSNTESHKILQVNPGKLSNGVNETPVAVKSFNVGNNVGLLTKLRENADLMYRLQKTSKCKNIVNIIDFHFEENIKVFRLFTELCDFNLEQLLSNTLPDDVVEKFKHVRRVTLTVKKVALDILNGIEFIHKNHEGNTFIHRDIKPENIMFKIQYGECVVKINDFGICKITESSRTSTTTKLNQGSQLYMAPDIRQRSSSKGNKQRIEISDLRMVDMFAYGITLYDMLNYGSHPFQGKSDTHTACNILDGIRTELLKYKEKTTLNLVYNLTEASPNYRLTATETKMHPTFFTSEQTIELIKELKTKLQEAPPNLIVQFEEYNRFALNNDWREEINQELFEKFNYFGETKKSKGKYRKTLADQVRFIRNVVEHRRKNSYTKIMHQVFTKGSPSNHDLITYFNYIFNGFLIHVYCTAVRVFPELDFFKDCGVAHLKIADSYERCIQHKLQRCSIDSISDLSYTEEVFV